MRRSVAAILFGVLAVGAPQPRAQPPVDLDTVTKMSREAALRSLETLPKIVTEANFREMGFRSVAEARTASLGEPLVSYFMQLDELRQYQTTDDPTSLLRGGDVILYPLLVEKQPRSLVEVTRGPKGWAASGFGGARLAPLLDRLRAEGAAAAQYPERSFFEVRIPALQGRFLAFRAGAELTLIPLLDDPRGRWRAGISLPARKAFAQLARDAKQYKPPKR